RGRRLDPLRALSEFRGEDQACEDQEILRPLARPERDQYRARGPAARAQLDDGRTFGDTHAPRPAGSTSSNVEPFPTSLSTSTSPPSAWASSRAIASPRPVPPP